MKNIKTINELFDDEGLKGEFEIPYLKGEMGDEIKNWKKVSKPQEMETPDSFHKKILFRFPILNYFHEETSILPGGQNVYCNYISSSETANDGNKYYAQLVTSHNDGIYYINIILRDVNDFGDQSKWVRYDYELEDIDDVYDLCESFIDSCEKLGIITPRQKNPIEAN